MKIQSNPKLIALDWGTSSFRGWLLDGEGKVLESISADLGILKVPDQDFQSVYHQQLNPWFKLHGSVPVIASGMIGSRQGWVEAPYVACPSGLEELSEQLAYVPGHSKGNRPLLAIVPGMNHWSEGIPDVMRGEETQVFGAMEEEEPQMICILPGTHSKWVLTKSGRIEDFMTFMSGELFAVLKDHSILGKLMQGEADDRESFEKGCLQALDSSSGLLSQLFSARTMGLFQQVEEEGIHSYLSGLILGSELKEAFSRFSSLSPTESPILKLIGDGKLIDVYQRAFSLAGYATKTVPGNPAISGLRKIARLASIIE